MTNKEYYLNDLIKIAIDDGDSIAVDRKTNRPINCECDCKDCLFHDTDDVLCGDLRRDWLKLEHDEWEDRVKGLREGDIVAVFNNSNGNYLLRFFVEYDFENKEYICCIDGGSSQCAWNFCKKLPNVKYQEDNKVIDYDESKWGEQN